MTAGDAAARYLDGDHSDHWCRGRYRLRTTIRSHLPWFLIRLGVAHKGAHDCGCHDFYKQGDDDYRCYHCRVGHRTTAPWAVEQSRPLQA